MKLLFVCNQGENRSKTAAEIFRNKFETRSKGLYSDDPLNSDDLVWADIVFVMEDIQRTEISNRFPKEYLMKRILVLDVPDVYKYMDEKLVKELKIKMKKKLKEIT